MSSELVIILLTWIVLWGAIGAAIGERKGIGGQGFAAGALLGPIGVLLVAVSSGNQVKCRHCRKEIAPDATVCPHCQRDVEPAGNVSCPACGKAFTLAPAALGHVARCPHCRKLVPTRKPAAAAAPAP